VWRHVERWRRELPAARWVAADNYHFTLAFLGEREERILPGLGAALAPVFAAWQPFALQLAGAGAFPPARAARVLWIGLEEGAELQGLQASVAAAVRNALGSADETRPYHPHLTVARCRKPWARPAADRWSALLPGHIGERFRVERGLLYQSFLGSSGARYEVVEEYPLARVG
jgi:2'-5' RNA ligase